MGLIVAASPPTGQSPLSVKFSQFLLVADFVYLQTPDYPDVNFVDRSSGSPSSWDWDFGDGSPHSNEQNPTHRYLETKAYTVTLTVTKSHILEIVTKPIYIAPFLLGFWKGENNTIDSINGNDAVWVKNREPAYSPGVVGNCFDMTGNTFGLGRNIEIPSTPEITFGRTSKFAIEFYFNVASNSNIVYFQRETGDIAIRWDAAGGFTIFGNGTHFVSFGWVINNWYKLKLHYNSGAWNLYIDDVLIDSFYWEIGDGTNKRFIFNKNSNLGRNCLIDEIKIYNG